MGVVLLILGGERRVISDGFSDQEELVALRNVAWCPVLRQFGERKAVYGRPSCGFAFPKGVKETSPYQRGLELWDYRQMSVIVVKRYREKFLTIFPKRKYGLCPRICRSLTGFVSLLTSSLVLGPARCAGTIALGFSWISGPLANMVL